MTATALPSIVTILPELVLAVGALALILVGAFQGVRAINLVNGAAFALLIVAALAAVLQASQTQMAFNGSFVVDDFARFMKVVTLLGAAATLALAIDEMSRHRQKPFELAILVLLSSLGMLLMISANDLIALYVGLELSSLALYVLAAIDRNNAKASEAGLKYFVLGALSSGMLLYGASLIYGFTGSVSFAGISAAVKAGSGPGLMFGLVFLLAGLAFKISAVPFHMWTPDVYEGAPTPVTAYFAATNKIAAMALTTRVLIQAFGTDATEWRQIVVFISIASMGLGSFAAIGQRNLKRLMAYSSIGHVGYALVGLSAGTQDGVNGVLVYMAIYMAMTVGTFGLHSRDAHQGRFGGDHRGPRRPFEVPTGLRLRAHGTDVLARRRSAARRLLGEMVRVLGGGRCWPRAAGRHRLPHERRRRLLLPARREGHVFR